jgi:hypothetical protein
MLLLYEPSSETTGKGDRKYQLKYIHGQCSTVNEIEGKEKNGVMLC